MYVHLTEWTHERTYMSEGHMKFLICETEITKAPPKTFKEKIWSVMNVRHGVMYHYYGVKNWFKNYYDLATVFGALHSGLSVLDDPHCSRGNDKTSPIKFFDKIFYRFSINSTVFRVRWPFFTIESGSIPLHSDRCPVIWYCTLRLAVLAHQITLKPIRCKW